jgi:hypothetical protein
MKTSRRKAGTKRGRHADHTVEQTEPELTRGGQAGDLQGLSGVEEADSESVRGLVEEGQAFEAEVIDAVENAPDPDVAEITTREIPEDDVPSEYLADR